MEKQGENRSGLEFGKEKQGGKGGNVGQWKIMGKHVQPQHAAACCSTKNFAFFMVIHNCLSALFVLFALEIFCLTHVSSVLDYLSCHD